VFKLPAYPVFRGDPAGFLLIGSYRLGRRLLGLAVGAAATAGSADIEVIAPGQTPQSCGRRRRETFADRIARIRRFHSNIQPNN